MSQDLETLIRAAVDDLPGPDPTVTERVAAKLPAPAPRRRVWRWTRIGLGIAATATLAVVLAILFVQTPDPAGTAAPHWQPGDIEVPDLTGLRGDEIGRRLESANSAFTERCRTQPASCPERGPRGLASRAVAVRPSDLPVGAVVDQSPRPGEKVAYGTYVRLTLSGPDGPAPNERPAAPGVVLPRISSSGIGSLRDRQGAVTVLTFVSSECDSCRAELRRTAPEYLVDWTTEIIVTRTSVEEARKVPVGLGPTEVLLDEDGTFASATGVTTLPSRVVLDRQGRIVSRLDGAVDPEELSGLVTALRAESPPTLDPARATPLGLSNAGEPIDPSEVPEHFLTLADICGEIDPRRVWVLAESLSGSKLYVMQGPLTRFVVGTDGGQPDSGFASCGGPSGHSPRAPVFEPGASPAIEGATFQGGMEVPGPIVVPDGWTEATVAGKTIPIEHNGLLIDTPLPKGSVVRFTGPAGVKDITLR